MIRSIARPARKAKVARTTQGRAATHVFRDFVRQLERLDTQRPKPAQRGAR